MKDAHCGLLGVVVVVTVVVIGSLVVIVLVVVVDWTKYLFLTLEINQY